LIEPFKQSITCKKYPLDDVDNSPLSEYILPATKFIHEEFIERKKNILIHCMMGKSRSAAILIAYLMTLSSSSSSFSSFSSVQQALEFLKTKRSIVQPNDGFMKQLKTTFENTFEKAEAKQ
jgi:protein-tyrosine phosphatase